MSDITGADDVIADLTQAADTIDPRSTAGMLVSAQRIGRPLPGHRRPRQRPHR